MYDINKMALQLHREKAGKIEINSKVKLENKLDLSLAYTPGVAAPCLEIKNNPEEVYSYTSKGNMVAVITDGTAVLGLGNIGPKAALPVMEGKCLLFKKFAGIDAVPICLDTTNPEEIIKTVKYLAPTYGGINLEDISFPRCVEIEERLKEELDIPVFHDDQNGTAIVVAAALINACKLVNKKFTDLKIAMSGLGAAGSSIAKLLKAMGVGKIYAVNNSGIVSKKKSVNPQVKRLLDENVIDEFDYKVDSITEIMRGADVFIGVSVGNIVTKDMVDIMNDKPIVFALANPNPEISFDEIKKSKAFIYATGRSDYKNQINNVLAFPGIFKGAFLSKSKKITRDMYEVTAKAIASLISDDELNVEYIIPSVFDERVCDVVAKEVYKKAIELKIVR